MPADDPLMERFLNPGDRAAATVELASRGEQAMPILQGLFDGTTVNRYGVPYRRLGTPLDCGLVAAARLGPLARPLEPFLRAALREGHAYAADALGALETLEDESIAALADALSVAWTADSAAAALARCKASEHPSLRAAIDSSEDAAKAWSWATRRISNR